MLKVLDFAPYQRREDVMQARCYRRMLCREAIRFNVARGWHAGFTTVELMVTLVIVGIMMAIAIPVLTPIRTASEANALLGSLQFARSIAVKQGQAVVVCPSANPTATPPSCSTGTSWSTGWIVVVPASGSCPVTTATGSTTGDVVLQTQQAFTGTDTAVFSGAGGGNTAFCFTRLGFAFSNYTGLVTFQSSPVVAAKQRCTVLSGVGHVQVISKGQSDALGVTCT